MSDNEREVEQLRSLREIKLRLEQQAGQPVKGTELAEHLKTEGWEPWDQDPQFYVRTVSGGQQDDAPKRK